MFYCTRLKESPNRTSKGSYIVLSITGTNQQCVSPWRMNTDRVCSVLGKIFGPNRENVTEGRRKLHNGKLHKLYGAGIAQWYSIGLWAG
jgi:hypothetical protein